MGASQRIAIPREGMHPSPSHCLPGHGGELGHMEGGWGEASKRCASIPDKGESCLGAVGVIQPHLFDFAAGGFARLTLAVHSTFGCWHEVHSNGPIGCCSQGQSGVGFWHATLHDSIIRTTGWHDGRGTDGEGYFWTRPCIFQNLVTSLLQPLLCISPIDVTISRSAGKQGVLHCEAPYLNQGIGLGRDGVDEEASVVPQPYQLRKRIIIILCPAREEKAAAAHDDLPFLVKICPLDQPVAGTLLTA